MGSGLLRCCALACFSFAILFALDSCSLINVEHKNQPQVRNVSESARQGGALRERIMLLPFINKSPLGGDRAAQIAHQVLFANLEKSGQFVLVSSQSLPQLGDFKKADGGYDLKKLASAANRIGVSAVIEGEVLSIHAHRMGDPIGIIRRVRAKLHTAVLLRVVSGDDGKELLNQTVTGDAKTSTVLFGERVGTGPDLARNPDLIRAVVTKAARAGVPLIEQAILRMSWQGRVALVQGEKIYINAGRLSGIQIGDILTVRGKGQNVYDPQTGALIGHAPGRVKGTLEVIRYFGRDGAVSVVHSGAGFAPNDRVQLY